MRTNWFVLLFRLVFCGLAFWLVVRDFSNQAYFWAGLNTLILCWFVKRVFDSIKELKLEGDNSGK
jgi:hypothetical protein